LLAEIVVVEWNPVPGEIRLFETLSILPKTNFVTIRIITVPSVVHARYFNSELSNVIVPIAGNVGIRRAEGKFRVVKTQDVFYPDQMIEILARQQLESGVLYRTERHDVAPEAVEYLQGSRKDFLRFCRDNVILRNEHPPQNRMPFRLPHLFTNASGDFQLLSAEDWMRIRGYYEDKDVLGFEADSLFSYSIHGMGIREEVLPKELCIYKISHGTSFANRIEMGRTWLTDRSHRMPHALIFWLCVLFNVPARYYSGVKKRSDPRSVFIYKLLSMSSLWRHFKSRNWGLAREKLIESTLTE